MLAPLALAATVLSACTPAPEPDPTPTAAFASEEEAFAAAEETYRAYIDASNAVDFQDPATFEPLADYSSGKYYDDERKQLSEMHADGYTRGGEIQIIRFRGIDVDDAGAVRARSCNDVSNTTFADAEGNSLVPADRPNRYALDLTFTFTPASGSLLLVAATSVVDESCAE